jgi:hypothetical protein
MSNNIKPLKSTTISFTCNANDQATKDIFDFLRNPPAQEYQYDYHLIINSPEQKGKIFMFNKEDISFVDAAIDKVSINIRETKMIDPGIRIHEVAKST